MPDFQVISPFQPQGDQPAADPDASDLVEMADGIRRYRPEPGGGLTNGAKTSDAGRLCKRLVNGRWEDVIRGRRARVKAQRDP